jgi:hypothetical protein
VTRDPIHRNLQDSIMTKRNLTACVFVAALVAFIASSIWYGAIFGGLWRELAPGASTRVGPTEIFAQLIRNLIVAAVLARLITLAGAANWIGALRIGLWCWLGFEAMAIAGSVIHEGYPLTLYAIHTGDALLTTALMSLVIGLWRQRATRLGSGSPRTR